MFDADEWGPQSEPPTLLADQIHVWRADLNCDPELLRRFEFTLAPDEKARADRFHFPRDRNAFVATRGVLRDLLAKYVSRNPAELMFDYGARGKPSLRGAPKHPVQFNVSRSYGLALLAFTLERSVGVDIELIRPDFGGIEIAERYFSPPEIRELKSLPSALSSEGFFLCWTRKEAYVKARGEGLQIPLDSFQITLTPGKPERLESADSSRWSLRSLTPGPRYAGALVAEGKNWRVHCRQWKPEQSSDSARKF